MEFGFNGNIKTRLIAKNSACPTSQFIDLTLTIGVAGKLIGDGGTTEFLSDLIADGVLQSAANAPNQGQDLVLRGTWVIDINEEYGYPSKVGNNW